MGRESLLGVGSGRKAFSEGWEGSGGSPGGTGGFWRPSRWAGGGRESLLEGG